MNINDEDDGPLVMGEILMNDNQALTTVHQAISHAGDSQLTLQIVTKL